MTGKQPMIKGILFDKDGTLFDFNATWGAWTRQMLQSEVGDDPGRLSDLAGAMGYDLDAERFVPGSIVIAATVSETADAMLTVLDNVKKPDLIDRMKGAAAQVQQVPVTHLPSFFDQLLADGLKLGIATNDAEETAIAYLRTAGVVDHFHFIAGYDSGFGCKPAAGQLIAFCDHVSLAPHQCLMVGDSTHDLHAGRAAGM
ncbi:MAG: HAD family hydrolase, partial [Pseudomonadota bacterium]